LLTQPILAFVQRAARLRSGTDSRVAKTTGFAAYIATFAFLEEDVAKICCLCLLNGNRLSQHRFMPEDLSLRAGF
jgi:hypothetical protein